MNAKSLVRRLASLAAPLTLVAAVSCAPTPTPAPVPPPPPTAIISVSAGPIGTWINVASPTALCGGGSGGSGYLQAALTRSNGVVLSSAYAYAGPSFSGNGSDDPFVQLRVPATAAPGVHYVHLTCYSNYNEEFRFHPARFVVTAV